MADESSAISQLGSLALGNLLQEIGIDAEAGIDRLGLGPKPSAAAASIDKDAIYNDQYEDDEDDELARMHQQEDEDPEERIRTQQEKALQDRYLAKGLASINANNHQRPTVRGETDDFDDDDDDHNDQAPSNQRPSSIVKQEPMDDQDDNQPLFSLPSGSGFSFPGGSIQNQAQQPSPPVLRLPTPPPPRDVKEFWPDFDPNKVLDFTDFFAAPRRKKRRVAPAKQVKIRPSVPANQQLLPPRSTKDEAARASYPRKSARVSHIRHIAQDLLEGEQRQSRIRLGKVPQPEYQLETDDLRLAELDDWENRIIVRPDLLSFMPKPTSVERPVNHNLHSDQWMQAIIWSSRQARDPRKVQLNNKLVLDLNDEDMMIEQVIPQDPNQQSASLVSSSAPLLSRRAAQAAASLDPLNMSNDGFYELTREQRQRIQRQTLGALEVQHTKMARKLQLPFYKTILSKQEARSFHRPAMQFPINIPLSFSRVQKAGQGSNSAKKDRKRNKDADEVLKSTRDLTLKEQGSFVLYEYSEEHPPIPMKMGMGSILVNYYRKKDAKDEHRPKVDLGEPFILEPNDESPFLKFGSVEPGEMQPTLYNNLVRAPLFRHQPATTDLLLVRVTTKNAVRYYLRDIKNLFVVGQNYPLHLIPGPHARLVTNAIRTRLMMICRRLVEQSKGNRIKIHRIMKYFPDQTELQMRQRLKEFMEYSRRSGDPNQGYWRLRSTVPANLTPDDELEKLLPPEHMCLVEAMQAGRRHLLDAGYTRTADGADEDEDKEQGQDIEQLLAPWTTSKNFIMATQGKAMLKLHGPGDPTGRGEAFSFVRVSMKDVFYKAGEDLDSRLAQQAEEEKRSGHKYNVARQQQIYREEIDRIWNAQKDSLSSSRDLELTPEEANPEPTPEPEEEEEEEDDDGDDDDDMDAEGEDDEDAPGEVDEDADGEDVKPVIGQPSSQPGTQSQPSMTSKAKKKKQVDETKAAVASGKVLQIRRQVKGEWETEIVRDPKIIKAYIAARQRIADEETTTEALVPTGNAALDAARRKRLEEEIASRMRNQERRLARRNAKAVAEGRALPGAYRKLMADKPTTSRRCGRCGQVGHMSSNRACPLWGQVANAAAPGSISSASSRMNEQTNPEDMNTPSTNPTPFLGPSMFGDSNPSSSTASYFPPPTSTPSHSNLPSRNPSFSGPPPGSSSGGAAGGGGGGGGTKLKLKFKSKQN
ncbi:unnamed protein product [Sympodiomycopsis kandeliae]